MKRNSIAVGTLFLAASFGLGGCSWFHHRSDYYTKAAETRPLEVPPDLDTLPTANELVVPAPGLAARTGPSTVSTAPPAAASASVGGNDLHVADSVQNTWQRVGLALERAQIGTLSARDEKARTYTLDFNGTVQTKAAEPAPEHHWYSRIMHPFSGGDDSSGSPAKTEQVTRKLTVHIASDGDGARVSVEGDATDKTSADAARRVVQVLRERLS